MDYIDAHQTGRGRADLCGLEGGRRPVAPSSYYAANTRSPSTRAIRDAASEVLQGPQGQLGVYGVRKIHAELNRRGQPARPLHRRATHEGDGLRGIRRAKGPTTTYRSRCRRGPRTWSTGSSSRPDRPALGRGPDLLQDVRRLVYAAFILDVYSRRVVGWQVSEGLRTDLALDALEMGLWTRTGPATTSPA